MTDKIKDVYAWVDEQEDYWDTITAEKLEQLDSVTGSHVQWFRKHTTLSDILSWKRPVVISNDQNLNKQESKMELESESIFNETFLNQPTDKLFSPELNNKLQESTDHNSTTKVIEDEDQIILDFSIKSTDNSSFKYTSQLDQNVNIESPLTEENIIQEDNNETSERYSSEESNDLHVAPEIRQLLSKTPKHDDTDVTELVSTSPFMGNTELVMSFVNSPHQSSTSIFSTDENRYTPELDNEINTQSQNLPVTPKRYDENESNIPFNISPKRYNNDKEEDDDDDDEIQLVVSKRHFIDDTKNPVLSPVRNSTKQYTNISPIRTAPEHFTNRSPLKTLPQPLNPSAITATPTASESPVRYQSPFMSRLFKLGQVPNSRKSNGSVSSTNFITVRPKASESTTSIISAKENNISMSLLENNPKKRPIELITEPNIEVSNAVPCPPFKKPRSISFKQTNTVNNPSTPQTDIADEKDKKDENTNNENDYPIPLWARSPELYVHLKNQEHMDADSIFGPIPPLNLNDIFANPQAYLPEE